MESEFAKLAEAIAAKVYELTKKGYNKEAIMSYFRDLGQRLKETTGSNPLARNMELISKACDVAKGALNANTVKIMLQKQYHEIVEAAKKEDEEIEAGVFGGMKM